MLCDVALDPYHIRLEVGVIDVTVIYTVAAVVAGVNITRQISKADIMVGVSVAINSSVGTDLESISPVVLNVVGFIGSSREM